jgi:hypothetical protein
MATSFSVILLLNIVVAGWTTSLCNIIAYPFLGSFSLVYDILPMKTKLRSIVTMIAGNGRARVKKRKGES